jgi:hypothetical protein
MTRITRIEVIDENGRSYVNWEDDNNISWQFQDDGRTLKVFVNKVEPKSPVEEAYKRWMGEYPSTDESVDNTNDIRWRAFQMGWMKAQSKNAEPYCPDEPDWYDEVEWDEKDNPKPKTIRSIIDRWWMDTFTTHSKWDAEECMDDLADQIEFFYMRIEK